MSGRARGLGPGLSRCGLRLAECPYTAAVRWRNWRYDSGRAAVQAAGVPVVSVGNLTLGGTGKTPAVEWLVRWLLARGRRPGIVSRGYGARAGGANDESLELARKLPGVPQVLDPDRVRGARRAAGELGCDTIVLDDGFQHRRLHRDFDLVLIDALEPFGYEHVFPRGTLREPLGGWRRADALLLTRAELIDEPARAAILARVAQYAPTAIWSESAYVPQALDRFDGSRQGLGSLAGQPIAAFCGVGNPAAFRRALVSLSAEVLAVREFADHDPYPPREVSALARWADGLGVAALVCTWKDLVKVGAIWPGATPLLALASKLEIRAGVQSLEAALAARLSATAGA